MTSLIAALSENLVIGKDNKVPWRIPDDMQFFKETTTGNPIIMGRRTWESIPAKYRPLPDRQNIIVSSGLHLPDAKVDVCRSLDDALGCAQSYDREPFLIGGARIYAEALARDLVDTMYLTWVPHVYDGDTFFPHVDWTQWKQIDEKPLDRATVKIYTRVGR